VQPSAGLEPLLAAYAWIRLGTPSTDALSPPAPQDAVHLYRTALVKLPQKHHALVSRPALARGRRACLGHRWDQKRRTVPLPRLVTFMRGRRAPDSPPCKA
jgi:hypothetical protein